MKNCQRYISMYHCSPITGRRSLKVGKLWDRLGTDFKDLLPAIGEQRYIEIYF